MGFDFWICCSGLLYNLLLFRMSTRNASASASVSSATGSAAVSAADSAQLQLLSITEYCHKLWLFGITKKKV